MAQKHDAGHWRECAKEARTKAQAMTAPAAKREMLLIAEYYEHLAGHAKRTAGRKPPRSCS